MALINKIKQILRLKTIRVLLLCVFISLNSCSPNLYTSLYLPSKPFNENQKIDTNNKPLRINIFQLIGPNSVGGFNINFWCINNSHKTIKYLYVTFYFTNAVGDKVSGEIRHSYTFTGKTTGPAKYGNYIAKGIWKNVIYNNSVKFVKISNISIVYMDGTNLDIPGKESALFLTK